MRRVIRVALVLHVLVQAWALAAPAAAGEKPLPRLELGVGAGLLSRPDYTGSASTSTTVLPVPYVAYRGERIQLAHDGLVARLFGTESVRVGLSASASLPGTGSRDGVRRDMPRLLPTFEIGPSLDWRFSELGGHWDLRLPLRAVAAADWRHFQGIGWLAHPHLAWGREQPVGNWAVDGDLGAGPLWGSRRYHRYFYAVDPPFATTERPAYDPDGGYGGARVKAYLGMRRGSWRVALGITCDTLDGAVVRDSPLVETRRATYLGLGVFYSMWSRDP